MLIDSIPDVGCFTRFSFLNRGMGSRSNIATLAVDSGSPQNLPRLVVNLPDGTGASVVHLLQIFSPKNF